MRASNRLPNVILEGPDGSGKTTLARVLEKQYGYRYHHEGPPPLEFTGDQLMEFYAADLVEAGESGQPAVFDRHFLGETIYGPILRGGSRLSGEHVKLLRRVALATGTVTVLCLPPFEQTKKIWLERHKVELVKDPLVLFQIYHAYESCTYPWEGTTLGYVNQPLRRWLNPVATLPRGAAGDPHASYYFVGDQANHANLDLPFFALRNSSLYLQDCLDRAGFQEEEVAFFNAKDLRLRDHEIPETDATYVALGQVAAARLDKLGVRFVGLPHPAYWKRFHSHQQGKYVKWLQEVRRAGRN